VIVSQSEVVTNKAETKRMETRLQSLSLEEKVSLLAGADNYRTVAIPEESTPALKTSNGRKWCWW